MKVAEKPILEPPADASQERQGLPVLPPWVALAEIVVLLVVPALLDYTVPGFPSLSETQPHFFWLPVLLLSLQYGTVSGLLAAGVAIGLSALLGLPDQEVGENHFSYLLRIWTQPVLWLATAILLGQFRMRQIEQKQELTRRLAELQSQRTTIADYATNLRTRCEMLEREIAGRRAPQTRTLLDALGRLQAGKGEVGQTLSESLELAFGPCEASIYVAEADQLRRIAHAGTAGEGTLPPLLSATTAIYVSVVAQRRSLSVLAPGDETTLDGAGLAAVPIRWSAEGPVVGMLTLESVASGELDETLPSRLAVIATQVTPLMAPRQIHGLSHAPSATVAMSESGTPPKPARLWRQLKRQRPLGTPPGSSGVG